MFVEAPQVYTYTYCLLPTSTPTSTSISIISIIMDTANNIRAVCADESRLVALQTKVKTFTLTLGEQFNESVKTLVGYNDSVTQIKIKQYNQLEGVLVSCALSITQFERIVSDTIDELFAECPDLGIFIPREKFGFSSAEKTAEIASLERQLEEASTSLRQKTADSALLAAARKTAASRPSDDHDDHDDTSPAAPTSTKRGKRHHLNSDEEDDEEDDEEGDAFSLGGQGVNQCWNAMKVGGGAGRARKRTKVARVDKDMHAYRDRKSKSKGETFEDDEMNDDMGTTYVDNDAPIHQAVAKPNVNRTITAMFRNARSLTEMTKLHREEFIAKISSYFGKRLANGLCAVGLKSSTKTAIKTKFATVFFCHFLTDKEKGKIYDMMAHYFDAMPDKPTTDMRENADKIFHRIMQYVFNLPELISKKKVHPFQKLYDVWSKDECYEIPVGSVKIPEVFFFSEFPEKLISSFFWALKTFKNTALGKVANNKDAGYIECDGDKLSTGLKSQKMSPYNQQSTIKNYNDIFYVQYKKEPRSLAYTKRFGLDEKRPSTKFSDMVKGETPFKLLIDETGVRAYKKMFRSILEYIQTNSFSEFDRLFPEEKTPESVAQYNTIFDAVKKKVTSADKKSEDKVEAGIESGQDGEDGEEDEEGEESEEAEDNEDNKEDEDNKQGPEPKRPLQSMKTVPKGSPSTEAAEEDDSGSATGSGSGSSAESGSESEGETDEEQPPPTTKAGKKAIPPRSSKPAKTTSAPKKTASSSTTSTQSKKKSSSASTTTAARKKAVSPTTTALATAKNNSKKNSKKPSHSEDEASDSEHKDAESLALPFEEPGKKKNKNIRVVTFDEQPQSLHFDKSGPTNQISDEPLITTHLKESPGMKVTQIRPKPKAAPKAASPQQPLHDEVPDAGAVPGILSVGLAASHDQPSTANSPEPASFQGTLLSRRTAKAKEQESESESEEEILSQTMPDTPPAAHFPEENQEIVAEEDLDHQQHQQHQQEPNEPPQDFNEL